MSELHLELTELGLAGVDLWDTTATLAAAEDHGFPLTQALIIRDVYAYLDVVSSWFGEGPNAALVPA